MKDIQRLPSKTDPRDLWPLRHLIRVMRRHDLKERPKRLVTFETLITFLTIKNNNLNIHSDPWIESDRDSICNSCDVFLTNCMSSIINFLAFLPNYTWRKFDILCMLETCASLTQAYFALIIWAKHSEEQKIIFFWQYKDTLRIFILSKKISVNCTDIFWRYKDT